MTTPKFCKDCKWCDQNNETFWMCRRPKYNLVSGQEYKNSEGCDYERSNTDEKQCGEIARFFTPKEAAKS